MSIQDVEDVDAGQGGDAEGSSPQKETAGLRAALQAERGKRQTLEREMGELKGTVDTLKQTQTQPKEHTKAELQTAVDAGQISQVDADRTLEEQQTRRLETKVATNVQNQLQQQELARKITAEIDLYRQFRPDIEEEGSESRTLVAAEYNRQVNELGKPTNMQTELDALAATFGPASKLQKGRQQDPETHQDVGSDGGGGEGGNEAGKPPKGLSRDMKEYYGKKIDQGFYKDWSEVGKELEYASPKVKARQGIA